MRPYGGTSFKYPSLYRLSMAGVSLVKGRKADSWAVHIKANGKNKCVGYYGLEEQAARAYDKAAREYHKDKAILNFPDENHDKDVELIHRKKKGSSEYRGR